MDTDETERKPDAVEHIPATDARDRLTELMDRARFGEKFILTRNGKPVAAIVGAADLTAA